MHRTLFLAAILVFISTHAGFAADSAARWWKGNLHTHSLWSDGDDYPEMITDWYKQRGYDFLGFTEHNTLQTTNRWSGVATNKGGTVALEKYRARFGDQWVEQREQKGKQQVRLKKLSDYRKRFEEPGKFLLLQCEEITSRYKTAPVHVNAHNLREIIPPQTGDSVLAIMQSAVDAVLAQRERTGQLMFPHVNHPNFGWGITAEELAQVRGEKFFEVYNGHPQVHNEGDDTRAGTERVWDIVLAKRLAELNLDVLYGVGTDDSHQYHTNSVKKSNPGRGWVMVRAKELTVNSLLTAMEAGDFYASSGVTLKDVRRAGNRLSLEIVAEPGVTYTTQFIGTRKGASLASEPVRNSAGEPLRVTHRYGADIGAVLAEVKGATASYTLKGDELYVRATIVSTKPKENPYREGEFEQAWTQPVVPGVK
ncbi:MAG: hypothetical protein HZA89_14490 [Verrucomicrobia bacterium]|nr:hypothetical protein [Verrucomicrobiota bacterium]